MNHKQILATALLIGSLGAAQSAWTPPAAAATHVSVSVGLPLPPPIRVETVVARPYPRAVWVAGYWDWRGGDWVWVSGHWVRAPRVGAVWVHPRYERYGRHHRYVRYHHGYWRYRHHR